MHAFMRAHAHTHTIGAIFDNSTLLWHIWLDTIEKKKIRNKIAGHTNAMKGALITVEISIHNYKTYLFYL